MAGVVDRKLVRIAITGAAGIGKTTLAHSLAVKLKVPVLHENFQAIVKAFNTHNPATSERCKSDCYAWLAARELVYRSHTGFIEDRCAIDVLFRWLISNLSDKNNTETHQLLEYSKKLINQLDYVVIPPFSETTETSNHDGITRVGSTSRLFRAQSLAIGIATQFLAPEQLIMIPNSCDSIESRVAFVFNKMTA